MSTDVGTCSKCSNQRVLNAENICAMCVSRTAAVEVADAEEMATPGTPGDQAADVHDDKVVSIERTAPAVSARITITLYEDGNAQVDGPFEDRILFKGLLGIAEDVEREMYAAKRVQALRQHAAEQKMPWWKRQLLERKRKKAMKLHTEKQQAARRDAERLAAQQAASPQGAVTK